MDQFDIENFAEMMPSYLLSGIPGAMYYAYYYTKNCGSVPEMFAGEGPFLELLKETCPILKEEYRPPPLVHESRLMTIVASLGRHRGLSHPYMREVFETADGAELALDWWDARLKPASSTEIPVVPSSLLDSLSHYYNSLPHLRLPQLQIPHMRMPQFQLPYFGPLKRSASVSGIEITHLESLPLHTPLNPLHPRGHFLGSSPSESESRDSAYSPREDAGCSERAPSPDFDFFFDSDDGGSSDVVGQLESDIQEEISSSPVLKFSLNSQGDVEEEEEGYGLDDLEVAGLILTGGTGIGNGNGGTSGTSSVGTGNGNGGISGGGGGGVVGDVVENHSTLFESLTYYYNYFLPHLRMPHLQIPSFAFSALPELLPIATAIDNGTDTTTDTDTGTGTGTGTGTEGDAGVTDSVVDGVPVLGGVGGEKEEGVEEKGPKIPETVPEPVGIVLILPGMTGDSSRNYIQGLVQVVEQLGFTAVVMNYRGATGNLKACFMADTTDVAQVIRHLKQRYPAVPIIAIGVSLGGILLTNYLARCGLANEDSQLLAVMTVSVAWNFFESAKALEEPLNWLLFNRMLTRALCDAVQKNSDILETAYDLKGLQDVRTLRQFDDHLTAKMFGYANADEYYKSVTLHDKIAHIKTPLLAINAADDVFSPYAAIPKEEAKTNPNLAILVTSHGGHIGFLEGRNPFGTNYVERVFQQFAKAVFENREKVEQMATYGGDLSDLLEKTTDFVRHSDSDQIQTVQTSDLVQTTDLIQAVQTSDLV